MTRRMLIDASRSEETRVVALQGTRLEEFDYDSEVKKQLKGNVYLAKVTRVEPSLQAAFIEYGGNRHGFLAFNEIHPDYYKIPVADRKKLLAEEAAVNASDDDGDGDSVETIGGDELEEVERRRMKLRRRYKIQEVTKRGQILLVQVVKEERGNKGAALTTYLSLPGRYCVLMPNTARGGGISRKITSPGDRKRLKNILDDLGIPEGMAVIVRTAGSERTKAEIKRDFDYLVRLWDTIRTDTLQATAPSLIYEEANLIKRAIRDLYTKEIEEVLVEGDAGYRAAKDFMRTLMPSHAKRVQPYKNDGVPIFQKFQVDSQIDAIHSPDVKLPSGGYIVLNQTEALVAIDVNSGRSTRERHIEETALKTNLEAADEVARQLRLRDLAGLIVIDFIDMEESRNNHAVERRLKEALHKDRARIQVGRISHFGLLEMSRQRLRSSLAEMSSEVCHHCGGTGFIRSVEWTGLHILRAIEEEALRHRMTAIHVSVPSDVALYILNQKRSNLSHLESEYEVEIAIVADASLTPPDFKIDGVRSPGGARRGEIAEGDNSADGEQGGRRKRRSRRRRRRPEDEAVAVESEDLSASEEAVDVVDAVAEEEAAETADGEESEGGRRRRKRGRRGGRRRGRKAQTAQGESIGVTDNDETFETDAATDEAAESDPPETVEFDADPVTAALTEEQPADTVASVEDPLLVSDEAALAAPKPRRRRTAKRKSEPVAPAEPAAETEIGEEAEGAEKPAKRNWRMRHRKTPAADAAPEADAALAEEPTETAAPEETAIPANQDDAPLPEEPANKRTGWWNRVSG